jgi:hypothetical protein
MIDAHDPLVLLSEHNQSKPAKRFGRRAAPSFSADSTEIRQLNGPWNASRVVP